MNHAGTPQKCKLLFVDDSHTEINYLKLLFQFAELPATADFMISAHDALTMLESLPEADFPDFIIVDINMPLMDGFEFTEKYLLKFKSKFPQTYLFIYSTSLHSKDVLKAESIDGVQGFISKPFDEAAFNQNIRPLMLGSDSDTDQENGVTATP